MGNHVFYRQVNGLISIAGMVISIIFLLDLWEGIESLLSRYNLSENQTTIIGGILLYISLGVFHYLFFLLKRHGDVRSQFVFWIMAFFYGVLMTSTLWVIFGTIIIAINILAT